MLGRKTQQMMMNQQNQNNFDPIDNISDTVQGILLVNKPKGKTSFNIVAILRKRLGVQKIGHAGTLDPFATGVLVMLIGRNFTRLSDSFLNADKEYVGKIHLGVTTDTYDCDGKITNSSPITPSKEDIEQALKHFQGEILQYPPMYSAKKQQGKKLYELARKGLVVEREPVKIKIETELLSYNYPHVDIHVTCSKGTYIRSIAHDLGQMLGCGAHLSQLERTRSGIFHLKDCIDGSILQDTLGTDITKRLRASYPALG